MLILKLNKILSKMDLSIYMCMIIMTLFLTSEFTFYKTDNFQICVKH